MKLLLVLALLTISNQGSCQGLKPIAPPDLKSTLADLGQALNLALDDIKKLVDAVLKSVSKALGDAIAGLKDAAKKTFDTGKGKALDAGGLLAKINEILNGGNDTVGKVLNGLLDNLGKAGRDLLEGLVKTLGKLLGKLGESLGKLGLGVASIG